jgi:hypothetical protein
MPEVLMVILAVWLQLFIKTSGVGDLSCFGYRYLLKPLA